MVINKHGSFYLRSGWGTKIIDSVSEHPGIFSPANEQAAIDNIGLGRIMIKALRYWAGATGLCTETKVNSEIILQPTKEFETIEKNDKYFQRNQSLLLLHRNLAKNVDEATAWYWLFNEWKQDEIDKETFVDAFHPFLSINGMSVKQNAVEKEYNCLRSTYITDKTFDLQTIMDEDTYPFFGPLHILQQDGKKIKKRHLSKADISAELLIYSIAMDNTEDGIISGKQISIDKLVEEKKQVGKYYTLSYSKMIEILLEAENKGYIRLYNNFGNRIVEFLNLTCDELLDRLYESR
ncbi:DUF4007 family protein [Butyrivibrio sp. VCD2006]|uniref:DUF4007 family protein n=1 Tax=Butyrivibrio sp. VCD2006 TaxID=1280664 RepID=UPI000407D4F9|nr:DUF4007 family protein [Butyrivibrio sp. VCD2006]